MSIKVQELPPPNAMRGDPDNYGYMFVDLDRCDPHAKLSAAHAGWENLYAESVVLELLSKDQRDE